MRGREPVVAVGLAEWRKRILRVVRSAFGPTADKARVTLRLAKKYVVAGKIDVVRCSVALWHSLRVEWTARQRVACCAASGEHDAKGRSTQFR